MRHVLPNIMACCCLEYKTQSNISQQITNPDTALLTAHCVQSTTFGLLTNRSAPCMQTEEQLKKRVGAKLEVAKFLQDTVSEMAKDMRTSKTGAAQASAADLYQFMKRVRTL